MTNNGSTQRTLQCAHLEPGQDKFGGLGGRTMLRLRWFPASIMKMTATGSGCAQHVEGMNEARPSEDREGKLCGFCG